MRRERVGAPWQAIVDSRAVLTAVQGLGSRFHQVVSPRGAAQSTGWRVAAGLGGLLDLAKARVLARDDRFRLAPRLVLDAADLALWCLAADDDTDTSEDAVIPGASLATEAGARLGLLGLGVPVVNAAVATVVRRRRGHDVRLEQFSWQLMGVGGGWVLRVLAERRRRRVDAKHEAELAARAQQAELAGLHDVIADHEGAIDLLQRASVLIDLGASDGHERTDFAGAVKAAVADAVRERATYLRDSLLVWQARRNLEPDLSRLVKVELGMSDGLVLLSGPQAAALHDALDDQDLVGTVSVTLADAAAAHRPFGSRKLLVNGWLVQLPEAAEHSWTVDALPAAFLMDLGWLSQPTGGHREAVPWAATAIPMALSLGAAAWSARRAARSEAAPPGAALLASLGTTLLYTVASTRTMRHPHTAAGVSRFPWVMALQGYELVRGVAAERLGPPERAAGMASTALTVAAGWALSPRSRSFRALLAELGWVAGFDLFARRLRTAIADAAEELGAEVAAHDADVLGAAYEQGRRQAEQLTAAALAEAHRTLEARAHELPPDVACEARRRLEQIGPSCLHSEPGLQVRAP